ncbi:hypothetical protein [Streptomyces sp. NPDC002889]|uniref:hypothetical protein n=1 Tax=Streptomyces sp. NPDC002889 TaxID=3364669 RepID=UPI0036B0CA9E
MPLRSHRAEDAHTAISGFLTHLEERGFVYDTRRLRSLFLMEYLEHALAAEETVSMTAVELMDLVRADAWLADAAAGKTRRRNTLQGPDAAAAGNSQRVRIQTWNAFAENLGLCAYGWKCHPPTTATTSNPSRPTSCCAPRGEAPRWR